MRGGGDDPAWPAQARRLAERYGLEFVDLEQFQIDHDLFRTIPADLMLQHLVTTLAYGLVVAIAGYFFFKTREVAA